MIELADCFRFRPAIHALRTLIPEQIFSVDRLDLNRILREIQESSLFAQNRRLSSQFLVCRPEIIGAG